jgi:hypothetical protein
MHPVLGTHLFLPLEQIVLHLLNLLPPRSSSPGGVAPPRSYRPCRDLPTRRAAWASTGTTSTQHPTSRMTAREVFTNQADKVNANAIFLVVVSFWTSVCPFRLDNSFSLLKFMKRWHDLPSYASHGYSLSCGHQLHLQARGGTSP